MASLNEIAIKILVDGKELDATIKGLEKDLNGVETSSKKAGGGMKQSFMSAKVGILAAAGAIAGVVAGLNKAVNIASDFQEANSKFNVVFSGMEKQARQMRKELVDAYAMSTTEATRHLAAVQDLLVPMGMNRQAAANLSGEIVKLSADLGSFNNQPTEQVMMDIQSALVGNFETMKKYGVVLNETNVKQQAMNMGLYNGKGVIDAAARSQAAYELILKGSTAALGDMERTSDSYANTKKKVAAATEDLALQLGAVLLPIWNKVLNAALNFINIMGATNIAGVLNKTWTVLYEFVSRVYRVLRFVNGILYDLYHGGIDAVKKSALDAWDAIANGWDETMKRIDESYDQGVIAYEQFIEGEKMDFKALQESMREEIDKTTQKELDAQEERKLKSLQTHWQYQDKIQAQIDEYNLRRAQDAQAEYDAFIKAQQDKLRSIKSFTDQSARMLSNAFVNQWQRGISGMKQFLEQFKWMIARMAAEWAAKKALFTLGGGIFGGIFGGIASLFGFQHGGEARMPQFAMVGEGGPEIIAPKKDYIEVHNQMIQRGEIGGMDNSKLISELQLLRQDINNLQLNANFDSDELAIIVEKGNDNLGLRTI